MRRQDHRRRLLHHEEVGCLNVPNQVVMEMEMEVSLVGDGGYTRAVLVSVPFKGEGGKRHIDLMLGLVKEVEKEEEGANLRKKYKVYFLV